MEVLFELFLLSLIGAGGVGILALMRAELPSLGKQHAAATIPPETAQAVTEMEIIEALGHLSLSSQSLQTFRDKIQTVAELKTVVAQLQLDARRYIEDRMLSLAKQYVWEKHLGTSQRGGDEMMAKMLMIAQIGAPHVVHPAFASLENQIHALFPTEHWNALVETMRNKLIEIDQKTIQYGPWVNKDLARSGTVYGGLRTPDYNVKYGHVRTRDSIKPSEDGSMLLCRGTVYSNGDSSSRGMIAHTKCSDAAERKFWIALASAQVEHFVKGSKSRVDCFQIEGDLMSWSRFLEALQAFEPVQQPVNHTASPTKVQLLQSPLLRQTTIPSESIAVQPDAEVPVEILEELTLRKRS